MKPFETAAPPYRGLFHPRVDKETAQRWLSNPEGFLTDAEAQPQAQMRGAAVSGELFVKYREASLASRLRRPFGDGFTRSLELGISLEAGGILTSPPLALIRRAGRRGEGRWLIMDTIDGLELGEAISSPGYSSSAGRAALFHRLALAVAKLHDAGFRQRDLKAPNILIRSDGEIVLVDLEGMRNLGAPVPERLRIKDLARLGASFQSDVFRQSGVVDAEWQALLCAYCEGTGRALLRPNRVAEQVLLQVKAKVRKNAQKGRPLS